MKTVNLLPEWYQHEERKRRAQQTHLAVLIVLGVLMAGSCVIARAQIAGMYSERNALAHEVESHRDITVALTKAQEELKRLQRLQAAFHDVGNTMPMTRVIQQFFNNMTPGMALSRVSVEVHSDPYRTAPGAKPRFHDVAHISVTGIAPDAVRVAQLIGKLSANPLFSEITLNYSRTELLNDYSVKRFEILLTMDLGRLSNQDPDSGTPQQANLKPSEPSGDDHAG